MKAPTSRRAVQLLVAATIGAVLTAAVFSFVFYDRQPRQPSLSETDIGFAQDMIVHHQQAAIMADMLTLDTAPEVRALADQIRLTQIREIGIMMGWLQIVGAPMTSSSPMKWMGGVAHNQHPARGAMMGMASQDDLTRLQRVTGRDNEILFLQLMIRHHQGGIDMAAYAYKHTLIDTVRKTAAAMVEEQTQEVGLMTILLEQRSVPTLPYP
ncbi:uncharacterized protein (DUF305 family) [Mycolicibacterium sp. BK634]|uniref:DUF305 domain-containing protein n=1 Tax=Mycolicibacterium sp. BK634 TaxID=2587099 RepID=UPI00160BD418|nr:DUF305 domain-containing protein [Mycolicibacterium sp. BK634]MBB3753809.1 uncharacterized protein (DUF305 family) [Mycolicibacterium sp. BK634]